MGIRSRYLSASGLGIGGCAAVLAVLLAATAAPAPAQEDSRVPSLREGSGIGLPQSSGAAVTSSGLARLDVRISSLEDDVRTLTGRVEKLGYDMRQLSDRLNKVMSDLEFRLNRLEEQAGLASQQPAAAPAATESSLRQAAPMLGGSPAASNGAAAESSGSARPGAGPEGAPGALAIVPRSERDAQTQEMRGPAAPPPAQPGGPVGGSPQEQYAYAFSLLQAARYDEAEQALKAFLLQNPDHALSDNARYWLGETYYVRGQYPEAAQQFVEAYQKNRSGAKAADALLKLGMSLSQLGKTDEACATFRELSRTQPDAPETVRDKAAKEAQRTGCS